MSLEKWIWMFPVALCVHNLEEAIWLPGWSQRAGYWMNPVGTHEFRIAAALLAILGIAVTAWAARGGKQSVGVYLLAGFALAMLLNVGFHVMATAARSQYAPGVVTAVTINLPVMSYLLRQLFRQNWILWPKALTALIAVPLALVLLIPGLLWIGRTV